MPGGPSTMTTWMSSRGKSRNPLKDYDILPDPNWEENKRRIEEMARRTLAKKRPGRMTRGTEETIAPRPTGLLSWRSRYAL